VSGKQVQDALNKINAVTLDFTGFNGLGTFTTPTWDLTGTDLLYGISDDSKKAPTYSETPPTNLSNGKYL
jgi:hypothetical protein